MVRRFVHSFGAALICTSLALLAVSCEYRGDHVETRVAAIAGDPIESIQQVQGVAPAPIDLTFFPPDSQSIESASFAIGLFDEDAAQCTRVGREFCSNAAGTMGVPCICTIMADLNPQHIALAPGTYPLPAFEDISVVEAVVNVGSARQMHWDWQYKAYYQRPFGEFWVDVVDQEGQVTTVVENVAAPDGQGFRPGIASVSPPFTTGLQRVDLDLTPWLEQRIVVRFSLRSAYDPAFFGTFFVEQTGQWDAGASKVYVSNLRVDTCSVQSVEFEEIDSPLDTNPGIGFGKRIFPDKRDKDDSVDRSTVCIVARTSRPNCPVKLRVLDMDDPSTDAQPVDPNGDGADDNDARSSPALVSTPSCMQTPTSGSDAVARTALRVTKFPGDNFAVVAGTNAADVAGVTTKGTIIADAQGVNLDDPLSKTKRTPMLTIWRRLHIERESMGLVAGNHAAGTIRAVTPSPQFSPNSVQLRVDMPLDLRRFENGRLVVGGRSLIVRENTASSIYLNGSIADLLALRGRPFVVYDDDDFNRNDGTTLHGDEGEDVRTPNTLIVQNTDVPELNVFAPAYVRPVYDLGSDGAVAFALNLSDEDDSTIHDLFSFDDEGTVANDPDFWALYLLGAYQGTIVGSRDPNDDAATLGLVDCIGCIGAVVFVETISDVGETALRNEATIVAHELGHLLCLQHGQGGLMGKKGPRGRSGRVESLDFRPASIATIRNAPRWYGHCEISIDDKE